MMKTSKKIIEKGQYLSDIIDTLPSDTIIFKTATGIGATHLELSCQRNSIIIEPNVPVIKGKKKRGVFGVYEGIDVSNVMDYFLNTNVQYKKILVTPESFGKVKEAAENLNIDLYNTYFLLFDECDRTMKDVAFRKNIILPMDDFFKFEQKAFISATAVAPTDPRFEEQSFEIVLIEPTFDYSKDIEVIITNNVSLALKSVIEEHRDKIICVFLNSIKAITAVVADLDIKTEAHIFCSREKMYPLKGYGYNAYDHIDEKKYGAINFYTSRFNSAVDINMKEKPVVILATNLHYANHTMIDPRSEAVQIIGRFRKGVGKLYAISNTNEELSAKTKEEAISFLEGCEQCYNHIKTLRNSTSNAGAKSILQEALKLVTFFNFVKEDGSKNHYMFDNFLHEESVKLIFKSQETILKAYQNKHFNPTVKERTYEISDADYKIAKNGISMTSLVNAVVNSIKKLQSNPDGIKYMIDNRDAVLNELQKCFPDIYNAFFILGEFELLKNAYSSKQIKSAVKAKQISEQKSNFSFIEDLHEAFPDGYEGSSQTFKSTLKDIILKHGLDLKAEIKLLAEDYFNLSPRRSLKGKPHEKGFKVISSKFNRIKDSK
ncbi:DEAD/DEAH box helicase family protein [Pedobacter sp. N36a]|uniref:DEAD/DEAH box helicase family protein n=1 Tax=Pedobacter sp. N36a TaxID=2767996 RepID=UPI001656E7CB|nr:DEAD/DEAH box helicase family protein [Pedobacter sp. N36a]MBC8987740.1 DEAD/DEAH box helicase family protein [Pedobacter sp. N36a]